MSLLKSIKQQLGLGPAAENHFWDGSTANQLSLKRGTPDAPGTELIKALNGILSFPNQGQLLAGLGYVKLPGGLIVQWRLITGVAADNLVTFAIPFPNAVLSLQLTPYTAQPSSTVAVICSARSVTLSDFVIQPRYIDASQVLASAADIYMLAVGY